MKKLNVKKSKGMSFFIKGRGIPKGCQQCLEGTKVVLFLNGICQKPLHCAWYCPISEERRGKDTTFADEIKITSKEELLEEINQIKAKGMSITGGEPLLEANLEKTLDYIKYIKSTKGKKFHIHLYTNGINVNESIAKELAEAGLDELRFHPPIEKWENIKLALNKGMSVGAEVPVIPDEDYMKNLEEFILYLDSIGAKFVNLNEFEFVFPNSELLKKKGFKLKKGTIASVENSKEAAIDLINKMAPKTSLKIHFCSIVTKDHWQLEKRYLRRATTIKLPFEEITEEGLLLFGQIEGDGENLKVTYNMLTHDLKIQKKLIYFEGNNIKLPVYVILDDNVTILLNECNLKGYVVEIIPFRGEYCQITEKTPIEIFKKEVNGLS